MTNDTTLQFYADRARGELAKHEPWTSITPRLALEVFEELLVLRRRIRAVDPEIASTIGLRIEDIPTT